MASMTAESNDILAWVRAGLDPHPVIPPNASLHPNSNIPPKNRGKTPGVLVEGTEYWAGLHWNRSRAERLRLQQTALWAVSWHEGNGGLLAPRNPAIDIDCLNPFLAQELTNLALRILGPAPMRIGQAPKCLLMYAAASDELEQPTRVFRFTKEGEKPLGIEILAAGRQYVVKGVHPVTTQPYRWDTDPLAVAENGMLTTLTMANLRAFIDAMKALLAEQGWSPAGISASGGGRRTMGLEAPPVASLRAHDMAVLASAVAAVPNPPETPREDYIAMGYALKAAAGADREMEGFLLWVDWAEKWQPDDPARANTLDVMEKDWERLRPPYYLGADYVYDLAAEAGWSRLPVIVADFEADPLPEEEAAAPPMPTPAPKQEQAASVFDDDDLPPEETPASGLAADLDSDITVCRNFVEATPDLLYVSDTKTWRRFDGSIWRLMTEDDMKAALVDFLDVYAPRHFPPGSAENDRTRKSLTSSNRVKALTNLVPAVLKTRTEAAEVGRHLNVLVTPKGVVHLDEPGLPMRKPRREDYAIASTAVAPAPRGARPELFLQTLGYASAGVEGAIDYIQLALGNMLLGNPAQIVLILWGQGGNGKSTVLEAVKETLGTGSTGYAASSVLEMWQKPIDFSTVLLAGKRAAIASEFSPDLGWNESLVKAISGGDTLQARNLFQGYTEQKTACMPIFAFNQPPRFKRMGEAMTRRMSVVAGGLLPGSDNTNATIVEKDTKAKDRIIAKERPAILRWMLDGVERILAGESALNRPLDVLRGLEALVGEHDRVAAFISTYFQRSKDSRDIIPLAECVEMLKYSIRRDCDEEEQAKALPYIDSRRFATKAKELGYQTTRSTGGTTVFRGVKLRPQWQPPDEGADPEVVEKVIQLSTRR